MSTPLTRSDVRLADRHTELTRQAILAAAVWVLEQGSVAELTVRAIAKQAGVAERTVFRYYATRDELLDAVAVEAGHRMDLPPPPATLDELLAAPRRLYERFEASERLTKAALHTDLFHRLRQTQAQARWEAVKQLLVQHAPSRALHDRTLAAANIRYLLSATTWHYFRFYFGFSLDDTVAAAELTIRQTLTGLGIDPDSTGGATRRDAR